ncbi:MAG: DnaJ domain-containing protein [Clostridia bacterium]|nr:DnaJ domain-containing protein [Clostridia bacterium]
MKSYYEILEIRRSASPEEIKKAYRVLAKKFHPDINPGNREAEERFKEINEAYNTLGDETLKKAYDDKLDGKSEAKEGPGSNKKRTQGGQSAQNQYQNIDLEDIEKSFENFFGFNPKTKKPSMKKENKKNPLDATGFFDQYFGVKKK